jgi:transcription elongation factor Elf1
MASAAATNSKILLKIKEKEQKQKINRRCSICGKKLMSVKRRTSQNPLTCWQCMMLDVVSENAMMNRMQKGKKTNVF